jgi:16S rRNA (cytosine1407-C5)-methyltransferase
LGTLHKSPEVLSWWTPKHCERMAVLQKRLIDSAVKALRPGGELCYSTCTLSAEENEEVIEYVLKKFPVELQTINIPVLTTRPGLTEFNGKVYHPELNRAVRFYPFDNESEGFFIAKLKKTDKIKMSFQQKKKNQQHILFLTSKKSPVKKYLDYLSAQFGIPVSVFSEYVYLFRRNILMTSKEMSHFPLLSTPIHAGLTVARPMDRGAKLTTEGAHFFYKTTGGNTIELHDIKSLNEFVNRNQMDITVDGAGQRLVKYKSIMIGYGLADSGLLKSQFPKADWPFNIEIINRNLENSG